MSTSRKKSGTPWFDVAALCAEDLPIPAADGLLATQHRFEARDLYAVEAALASGRPLLVRGEPGTGKSQLARAVASALKWEFRWRVVDAHTEIADLFFTFDAVERLARAQVAGALEVGRGIVNEAALKDMLAVDKFVRPELLWWALDWKSAHAQQELCPQRCVGTRARKVAPVEAPAGCVVLIDEIDKADPSVPNGLLEALGQGTFLVPGGRSIALKHSGATLIVITTNEERELPSAFVRRCMVLQIQLPEKDLRTWLMARGRTHFGLPEKLLGDAADLVIRDRAKARELGLVPPGQAEYLDLLRAVSSARRSAKAREEMLAQIAEFALKKHPDLLREDGGKEPG